MASKLLLLCLLVNLLMLDAKSVGVCNGRLGGNLPNENDTVTLYRNNGISKMRIYDANIATLEALNGTGIELMIDVPNHLLQNLTNQTNANAWVDEIIQRYKDVVNFKYIAVGNEVNPDPNADSRIYKDFLLPAMQNVHNALRAADLHDRIKVSTATYTGVLNDTYPPSRSVFRNETFFKPIVTFLVENNLPMLANIYPYFGYIDDPNKNLPYALFTAPGNVVNDTNGLKYSNLFDAMLDAHYTAQARVGGADVEIVVSESGWPSSKGGSETTVENAEMYYKKLIEHVTGNAGTPLKPGRSIETYLFAMFDENRKPDADTEQHFGLFNPENQQPKYAGLSFN